MIFSKYELVFVAVLPALPFVLKDHFLAFCLYLTASTENRWNALFESRIKLTASANAKSVVPFM